MTFANIRDINIQDEKSWKNKIFLTFDIEWASDDILSYLLDIIEKSDIKATFFCTHKTKLLNRLRKNPMIELGIHPNFNFLLNNDTRYGKTINEVVEYFLKIIPESVSVRSHCLTQNASILDSLHKHGQKYDCNTLIPGALVNDIMPWADFRKGLIRVPLTWEDDVHCLYKWKFDISYFLKRKGIKVFNFHPVMIFLNINNISRYQNVKKLNQDYKGLKRHRFNGIGIKNILEELINYEQLTH